MLEEISAVWLILNFTKIIKLTIESFVNPRNLITQTKPILKAVKKGVLNRAKQK